MKPGDVVKIKRSDLFVREYQKTGKFPPGGRSVVPKTGTPDDQRVGEIVRRHGDGYIVKWGEGHEMFFRERELGE